MRLRGILLRGSLLLCGSTVVAGLIAGQVWLRPWWEAVDAEIAILAAEHQGHTTAHPGWSFPARVYSAPFSLEDATPAEVARQALARDYTAACPPQHPGEVCAKTGAVLPRGGLFPEGMQPPGAEDWTRPLALEPVQLGVLLGEDAEVRWHLPLAEAPPVLLAAILAAEDEGFYEHQGADLPGLIRAAWINLRGGGYAQGASTLTMQVVRNLSQRKDKTIERKLWEIAAAISLERHIGKEGVLQAYLDAPYLGQSGSLSICGFRAAALHYYGVDVDGLSLSQIATLAGILPAPGRYAPDRHPADAQRRRDMVLDRMAAGGWDAQAIAAARLEAVQSTPTPDPLPPIRHPAYLQATRLWLEATVPPVQLYGAGLTVFTAMDAAAQATSEAFMPEQARYIQGIVGKRQGESLLETVGVLIDAHTGHLSAVYGGTQVASTDFSRATQARRQVGSAFKPLVYALAFSQTDADGRPAWRAYHTVSNLQRVFPNTNGWRPKNIIADYSATSTLGNALVRSQNVATATLLESVGGPAPLIDLARRAGLSTDSFAAEMGLALGQAEVTPLEMARFVAMVLHDGIAVSGAPVVEIVTLDGGRLPLPPVLGERVLSPEAATLTRRLMGMVVRFGSGSYTRAGGGRAGYLGPSIGKTGTTDDEKDLWYIGGTPDHAAVVWLGYDQPARIGGTAADLAAPLWGWWMHALTAHIPNKDLPDFTDAVAVRGGGLCAITGKSPNASCEVMDFPLLEDDKPQGVCSLEHPHREKKNGWSVWVRRGLVEERTTPVNPDDAPADDEDDPPALDESP